MIRDAAQTLRPVITSPRKLLARQAMTLAPLRAVGAALHGNPATMIYRDLHRIIIATDTSERQLPCHAGRCRTEQS